jgi:hypothetical protein
MGPEEMTAPISERAANERNELKYRKLKQHEMDR